MKVPNEKRFFNYILINVNFSKYFTFPVLYVLLQFPYKDIKCNYVNTVLMYEQKFRLEYIWSSYKFGKGYQIKFYQDVFNNNYKSFK